ncbi:MAG: tRNA pseudouridine(13) synthase TruD [Candidatus Bathyarchaeia archaeon]
MDVNVFLEFDINLPYITPDIPGIGGRIKARPECFIVEEIPSYKPLGRGKHLYISITKELMTTRELQERLARLFNRHPSHIGLSGLKDKHARTTQTFSLHMGLNGPEFMDEAIKIIEERLPVKVNWAGLHPSKLRRGHLEGNRFEIIITEIDGDRSEAVERSKDVADRLLTRGVPNFYGTQRTGNNGDNIVKGFQIISGERRIGDKWLRRFLISSYLSHLCNQYLKRRIELGLFDRLLRGDLTMKHDTGGVFWVKELDKEQKRYEEKEISFTAPIYGSKMRWARRKSSELEEKILDESGITLRQLDELKVRGTRRLGRLIPEVKVQQHPKGVKLSFDLPKGAYATVVLREFIKSKEI